MERLPPLSAIRAFEAAGRHENFSRAADELGLTQAAVSYQIKQLEDRVGRPLFVREKGRVRLSDTGRRLLPAISGGFAGIADAFAALREEAHDVAQAAIEIDREAVVIAVPLAHELFVLHGRVLSLR